MADAQALREEGNQHFKDGNFDLALSCYTKALDLGLAKETEMSIIYKNRSACYLKLGQYETAIEEATKCLEITPNDPKALFRRCQAYEKMGKVQEAFKDAAVLMKVDPKNSAVHAIFKRLNPIVQGKIKEQTSTVSRVSQMFDMAFDPSVELAKRKQATNNLIVLAREEDGAQIMWRENVLTKLKTLLDDPEQELVLNGLRVLSCLSKGSKERSEAVAEEFGVPKILKYIGVKNEEVSAAAAHLVQTLITYITDLHKYKEAVKKYDEDRKKGEPARYPQIKLSESALKFVEQVFLLLINMIGNAKVSPTGRDNAIELIMKNVTWKDGVNWSKEFLNTEGIEQLLLVAGTLEQHKTLPITPKSKMHASVALSKIYDDLSTDQQRNTFKDKCSAYIKDLFGDDIMESKIEAIEAISTLLQGPFDVGNMILGTEGVVQIMFALANSENRLHQRVAVEAIVHSASKKDRCAGILKDAVPVLKKLYESSDDQIRVRSLVGLCKLGSFGGTDISVKPMQEGSTLNLAKSCRKYLTNPAKDVDLRKWATEGMAYLTLDADVKEELVNDVQALQSLFELATIPEANVTYAAVSVLVNITNSYDKQDIMPELVELAKFAKQHVPEEHPKDTFECVVERLHKIAKAGAIPALVALSGTESKNSKELIARVFLAFATDETHRGLIVQTGGVKALLSLYQSSTEVGQQLAAHALAKVGVTMDPHTAFPGQRIYEVVRPLVSLLHVDRSGLQNFEALMALTNLASVSDSVRTRIVKEKAVSLIDHYLFEEHEMIRRAAAECMCNLVMNEQVAEMYEGENDKVKLMVLLCSDEDEQLVKAAAGIIATLSPRPLICKKIIQVKPWFEIIQALAVNENRELQHRGCHILMNLMASDKEIAEKIVNSEMLEVLMAITKIEDPDRQLAKKCAEQALETAVEFELIKPRTET
ncbi:protein unc-45 homolog B-like [Gigantopelta aegis]|uniref:protein unc-45 homolog B-like n=1 Tax=Gigantopelta aegis TaxID=1735272 RepID=UPI001B88D337|nr:protein unc-45 homolog B-like [Gigantopelta aegis]